MPTTNHKTLREAHEDVVLHNLHYKQLFICILVGIVIWFLPAPVGVSAKAWHLFAIFIATILGLIIKPLPMGALGIIAMTTCLATNTIDISIALGSFSNKVAWLIVLAFFIAKAFVVTGFGNRIAYFFTGLFGKRTIGLSYSLAVSELFMASTIPSNTARSAGIMYPIIQSISRSYQSFPNNKSATKMGGFLTITAFQVTVVTSAIFLTGTAANPLIANFASTQNVTLDWITWFKAAIVPGIASLVLVPFIIYKIFPPEIKETPCAQKIAKEHLTKMGKMRKNEWSLFLTVILLILLWSLGSFIGMSAVEAAFIGISLLLLTGTLNWKTLMKEHHAWETFIWFCVLIMMAKQLNELGLIDWFSDGVAKNFVHFNWKISFCIISILYFYSHYFFASMTAHISSMYLPILATAIKLGTPPMLAAFVLAFFSVLYGGLTHYSTGPAPLMFGVGYVRIKTWWAIGFLISVINIIIWVGIGGLWWKLLGYW